MPDQDTARIPLRARDGTIRAYALVDATDAEWVNRWRWGLKRGYVFRSEYLDGSQAAPKTIRLHRALLGLTAGDGLEGDHINRNRLDNRRSNLRVIPRKGRGNAQNTDSRHGSTSPYRGVSWQANVRKWQARIRVNKRQIYLGIFEDEAEAAEVARQARLRLMPYAVD